MKSKKEISRGKKSKNNGKKDQFKDVVISILSTVARIEREQISDRTKAGLKRARKNGVILGRSSIPTDIITKVENLLRQGKSYSRR